MPSPASKFAIGQTPALVGGIPPVGSIVVLNSSEGLGDSPNAPDIVVDNSPNCALTPQQIGMRLIPGQLVELPMRNPSNGAPLQLFAVATGEGGQVTIVLNPDDSIEG